MFDVGFWELFLIGVLGLIVLGPERLPRVARTLGLWAGRARGYVRQLSQELDREMQSADLRRDLQQMNQSLTDMKQELLDSAPAADPDDSTPQKPPQDPSAPGSGQQ